MTHLFIFSNCFILQNPVGGAGPDLTPPITLPQPLIAHKPLAAEPNIQGVESCISWEHTLDDATVLYTTPHTQLDILMMPIHILACFWEVRGNQSLNSETGKM